MPQSAWLGRALSHWCHWLSSQYQLRPGFCPQFWMYLAMHVRACNLYTLEHACMGTFLSYWYQWLLFQYQLRTINCPKHGHALGHACPRLQPLLTRVAGACAGALSHVLQLPGAEQAAASPPVSQVPGVRLS